MKHLELSYSKVYPIGPVTGWTARPYRIRVSQATPAGQYIRDKWIINPHFERHNVWCQLAVHLDGICLVFAEPEELDHVREVFSKQVLQSTRIPRSHLPVGRPNNHWLSRLPKKAKSPKFRSAFERLVSRDSPEMRTFRLFYAERGAA